MHPLKRILGSRLGQAAILAGFMLAAFLVYSAFRAPLPEIPIPGDLERLAPQLRDHISKQLVSIRDKPRQAERHATLGLIYAVNDLWPEAKRAFENAAALNPAEPLAEIYAAVSAQEMGDLDLAIQSLRTTTKRFPSFAPGFYRLGHALLRKGEVDEAEEAFARLSALAPQEWRGPAGLGEIKIRKGQFAAAIPLLERAVQLDFGAKSTHHLLGQAYQNVGRTEAAATELQLGKNAEESPMPDAWTELAPQHIRILQEQLRLANEYMDGGEPAKGVEILAKALPYYPDNLNLMNQLAVALNRASQPQRAIVLLKAALQKDPNYVPVLITLSLCQQNLGENEAALATAERAIGLAPNVTQGHIAKANALLGMERDDEALKALAAAAQLDPQNAEIPMEMGDILWRNLSRPADARERYHLARQLNPGLAPVYVRLADLSLQSGEIEEAQAAITSLRRIAPQLPELAVLERKLAKVQRP
jgi:tetratricopeptide (TPR) repeat protein